MKKLALLVLLVAACDSPTVPERFLRDVYDFRLRTPAPRTLRWPAGTTVKVFAVAEGNATTDEYLRAAVAHGGQVWNTAALYGEVELEQTTSLEDADAVVQYSLTDSPLELSCLPTGGALGETTFCATDDGEHLAAFPLKSGGPSRVKFLVTIRTSAATDAATVRRLVTHELGHVLGIAQHSPRPTDLMFGGTGLNRDDPSPADRATLQVLYHTRPDITP